MSKKTELGAAARRLTMVALAAFVAIGGIAGARAEPARGGTLRVALPQPPVALDPVVSTLGTNWLVAANVCEGLFGLDEQWQPQPMLAASSTYDAAIPSLTVTLRPGIKFHSGAPLTADDVVASLQRFAGSAGTGAVLKSLVRDIKAEGTDKVVFNLIGQTGVLPGLLTLTPAVIMSRQGIDGHSSSQAVAALDCTGPYKVVAFQPDQQATLTRFDAYQSRTEPSAGSAGAKHATLTRSYSCHRPNPRCAATASSPVRPTSPPPCRSISTTRSRTTPQPSLWWLATTSR